MLGALFVGLVSTLLLAKSADAAKQPAQILLAPVISAAGPNTRVWIGNGTDGRWSNPANWQNGVIPAAADIVRFPANQGAGMITQTIIDSDFAGRVAGLILDQGYAGTVRLARDLVVDGDIVIGGGAIQQGIYQLATIGFRQSGGQFVGGSAPFTIRGAASLQNGIFDTPASTMNVATLDIQAPAIMRLAANAKLNITGDGAVLTGSGLLDTLTHRPNSVELTGQATGDLMSAGPMHDYSTTVAQHLPSDMRSALQNAAPSAQGASLPLTDDFNFWSAVIDTEQGFAYFGTWTKPGTIVKVRLSTFTRVGAIVLNAGENGLRSAVIDSTNGFAYFGTYTAPGKVVKVNLADFTRAAVLSLANGDDNLTAAVIDPAQGQAYFGTDTAPGNVVKVDLATFTRAAGIPLNSGEDFLQSAVIDLLTGNAYFGTFTTPGKVVKVSLASFSRVNNLTLNAGEDFLTSAIIDPAKGFAYFGTWTTPGRVAKIKLQGLTREGANTFSASQSLLTSAVIDAQNGLGYFGTQTQPGRVVKINLDTLALIDTIDMQNPKEDFLTAAVIDTANNAAYFGAGFDEADLLYQRFNTPGIVMKISLNPRVDTKKSTATVISASPNPSEVGQNVNFIVTVTGDGGTPTGNVTFYHHGSIGTGTLSGGIATFNTTTIPTETHIITATYNGDSNFVASTAAPFEHRVNQPNREGSKITVVADLNPSESGQQVKFTATVAPLAGAGGPPAGQVQFYVDNEKMGSPRTLINGVATTAYNKLVEVRIYTISAKYLGDSKYAGSDANVLNQDVKPVSQVAKQDTSTVLTITPNPSVAGQAVVLKATVTSGSGKPTGTVYFGRVNPTPHDEGDAYFDLGSIPLDANGVATVSVTTLPVGTHSILAQYQGNNEFNLSNSQFATQTVTSSKVYLPLVSK